MMQVELRKDFSMCSSRLNRRDWLAVGVLAVAYAIGMLAAGGATWTRLYGPSPYHRLQADALLHGHLQIGDSIYNLDRSLAWYDGKIQQVWGLGVGLWL